MGLLSQWGCRMGSIVSWVLWLGILGGRDWTLYLVAYGLWVSSLSWQGSRIGLRACVAFCLKDSNQARVCTEFPGHVRSLALLCRWGSHMLCHLFKPLYIGLLNALHCFPCALVRFPGWADWRLYSAVNEAMNWVHCSNTVGEAALKMVKLFVVLSQPRSQGSWSNRTTDFALQTIWCACLSLSQSDAV